jgi:hypothetical protein
MADPVLPGASTLFSLKLLPTSFFSKIRTPRGLSTDVSSSSEEDERMQSLSMGEDADLPLREKYFFLEIFEISRAHGDSESVDFSGILVYLLKP